MVDYNILIIYMSSNIDDDALSNSSDEDTAKKIAEELIVEKDSVNKENKEDNPYGISEPILEETTIQNELKGKDQQSVNEIMDRVKQLENEENTEGIFKPSDLTGVKIVPPFSLRDINEITNFKNYKDSILKKDGITIDDVINNDSNNLDNSDLDTESDTKNDYDDFLAEVQNNIDQDNTNSTLSSRNINLVNNYETYVDRARQIVKKQQNSYDQIYKNTRQQLDNKITNQISDALLDNESVNKSLCKTVITNTNRDGSAKLIVVDTPSINAILYDFDKIVKNKNTDNNDITSNKEICNLINNLNTTGNLNTTQLWPRNRLQCLDFNVLNKKSVQERYKAHVLQKKKLTQHKQSTKKFKWSLAHKTKQKRHISNKNFIDKNNSNSVFILNCNESNRKYSTRQSNVPGFSFLSYDRSIPLVKRNRKVKASELPYNFNQYTSFFSMTN